MRVVLVLGYESRGLHALLEKLRVYAFYTRDGRPFVRASDSVARLLGKLGCISIAWRSSHQ
ncbi:hypothetical protein D3C75_1235800 [compost metagenome]